MSRSDVDGQRCALRACALGGVVTGAHEAVRVTTPAQRIKRMSRTTAQECCSSWEASSQRTHFHSGCWELLAGAVSAPKARLASIRRSRGGGASDAAPQPPQLVLTDFERSVVQDVKETCERFCTAEDARVQAQQLAQLLRSSRHTVAFTGAGVSTSAGIPDYRGTAGVDTLAVHGGAAGAAGEPKAEQAAGDDEDAEAVAASASYLQLRPTQCHQALAALSRAGLLAYVITQNCDDLHGRSGLPRARLAELHGNVFVEYCERCLTEYRRPYCVDLFSTDCTSEPWFVRCPDCRHGHYTGRGCVARGCGGKLRDSIINFGDELHASVLGGLPAAQKECSRAQLILALGCSMSVTPARDLPRLRAADASLVLVNLQLTEVDADVQLRVFYPCDEFLQMVMAALSSQ